MKIPLTKPYITDKIRAEVTKVLDSGFLTEGAQTKAFEKSISQYIGCEYALAVCNCTVGLELALRALEIGPGDEVIVPDYTYPATASVVNIVGADIVLVDIDPKNMLIDYDQIEQAITPKTKAIMPVSLFGNPLDYERLNRIKKEHSLYIIEDAACSLGAGVEDVSVGNMADISVFSLHPRKFITTGEGGMVTLNNPRLADWMNSYKHFGMETDATRAGTQFLRIGTNYKMSNLQAAVGLAQMKYVQVLLEKRIELAERYFSLLQSSKKTSFPKKIQHGQHSYQSFCVYVENRDQIIEQMRACGIETQIGSYSLHKHKAFNKNEKCRIVGEMKSSSYAFKHCLVLPMYHDMTEGDQQQVVNQLVSLLKTG